MKSALMEFHRDNDCMAALNEAIDLLGEAYWLDIARDDAGQLGLQIIDDKTKSMAQFVPVSDPADMGHRIRVYTEVYGCLAVRLHIDDLSRRGQAIVICKQAKNLIDLRPIAQSLANDALAYAARAGVKDAPEILGDPPNFDALESRLAEIKYLILHLSMPTDAAERALALPEKILNSLGILKIRQSPEEK